jgi:quinolinate synthase
MADVIGSTSQMIAAAQTMDADEFIVATDNGILHKMKIAAPGKRFIEAPTAGNSATCKSCAHCPWMAMNGLVNLAAVLENGSNEIQIDPAIGRKAVLCIDRMLDFAATQKAKVRPGSDLAQESALFSGVGPA